MGRDLCCRQIEMLASVRYTGTIYGSQGVSANKECYMYVFMYVSIYVCMYVCTYIYTYIHTYIHTYINRAFTHTHTHTLSLSHTPPLLLSNTYTHTPFVLIWKLWESANISYFLYLFSRMFMITYISCTWTILLFFKTGISSRSGLSRFGNIRTRSHSASWLPPSCLWKIEKVDIRITWLLIQYIILKNSNALNPNYFKYINPTLFFPIPVAFYVIP